jgi:hypothetical protein
MHRAAFNPLDHPYCLEVPTWLEESAWVEHIPFAFFAVSALKPGTVVELGVYRGVSYCAFCQAVKALQLDTKCYGVDTWRGDPHLGDIDDSVLWKLRAHHDPRYGQFSQLIQSRFDDASKYFADASVDLLHIDGFHTYDAVRRDFDAWLPKMSRQGVILFHDIAERERGFEVWKLWGETCRNRRHFAFLHGHGLGVLSVGSDLPEGFRSLLSANGEQTLIIRQFFHELGARIRTASQLRHQNEYINVLQTYEKTVLQSRVMRAYRVVRFEGAREFFRKGIRVFRR